MAIRCWNYDDDGKPLGRGCQKGAECTFVHPSNPDWGRAVRNPKPNNGPRNSGSFHQKGGHTRGASGNWGERDKVTSTNSTKLPETGSRWGAPTGVDKAQSGSSSAGWGTIDGAASAVDYPGKTVKPATWDIPASSAWGDQSSGGGWGSSAGDDWKYGGSTGGWGTTEDSGSTWGTAADPTTSAWGTTAESGSSAWGAGNDANQKEDKGKGKEKEDVPMRDPSPPPPPPSTRRPPVHHDRQTTKPVLPQIRTDAQPARPQSPSQSPLHSPLTARPTNSLPLSKKQGRARLSSADNLKKAALELAASKAVQETGKMYPQDISGTQSQSPALADPKKYIGPKGRLALFSDILTHMQDLVISDVYLQRAHGDANRWKSTQNSDIYGHATPLTRNLLDNQRLEYNAKVVNATKIRDNALGALANLPDFGSRGKIARPRVTKEIVASYTAELRDWVKGLEAHKVLLIEKKADKEKTKALETQSMAGPVSTETQPVHPTAKELLERGNWSWRELNDAMDRLETEVQATSEPAYYEMYITPPEDLEMPDLTEAFAEDEVDRGTREVESLLHGINRVGEDLGAQAIRAATLVSKVDKLEKELAVVVEEKKKMDEIYEAAKKEFEVLEQSNQAHAAEIKELTEQLQNLHLLKRPSARQSSSPPPVKIDDIYDYIRPIVLTRMEADMTPFFEKLRAGCLENQKAVAKEIEQLAKPVVDMTEAICQRVLSMKVAEASAHGSSSQSQ